MDQDNQLLSMLEAKANQVATIDGELCSAIGDEQEARAVLLQAVFAAVRPSLRGISNRIKVKESVYYHGDVNRQRTSEEFYDARGVYLDTDSPGPSRDNSRDNAGSYGGTDYFLLSDGSLLELKYSGHWSKWQGSTWGWESKAYILLPEDALFYLVKRNRDIEAIASLSKKLDEYLAGNATKAAKAARERAANLRAIVQLMGAR